jgi:hypothetical protein
MKLKANGLPVLRARDKSTPVVEKSTPSYNISSPVVKLAGRLSTKGVRRSIYPVDEKVN